MMWGLSRWLVGLVLAGCTCLVAAVSVPHYVFSFAGNYPGAALTYANGANLTQIVGYYTPPVGGDGGYIQTGRSFITAQPAGSLNSYLFSINRSGVAAGGYCTSTDPTCDGALFAAHGYAYNYRTHAIATIDYPGAMSTAAYGINDLGVIVGGICPTSVLCPLNLFNVASHGFIDDHGVFTQLDYPAATETTAFGINNAGTMVGTYEIDGTLTTIHAFVYEAGTYTDINFPGANWSEGQGINNAGVAVGYYQDPSFRVFGFLYYKGQWAQINARNGGATAIIGINANNDLVGTWSGPGGNNPAIKGIPVTFKPPGSRK